MFSIKIIKKNGSWVAECKKLGLYCQAKTLGALGKEIHLDLKSVEEEILNEDDSNLAEDALRLKNECK